MSCLRLMFTIPFTRRVALSCLVVSTRFLHFINVFSCGPNGKPLFWICPWFSTLVVPSWRSFVSSLPTPHPILPSTYLCLQEKVTRLIWQLEGECSEEGQK
ncbi:hypothetical protein EV363DRAFT_20927 [Boletus edulis]|uniref:Secreted protein n=1 Tax=Boletus edulis BED1 TaxID=1328754 RepID=A0AAD4BBF0_BOLED|nr:hypothetical protein EV363DRAFT_20927 [Boletus edulis]KAF8415596.1 hypothetical protein L210DRAFT_618145 [Boletus edulis BED1]